LSKEVEMADASFESASDDGDDTSHCAEEPPAQKKVLTIQSRKHGCETDDTDTGEGNAAGLKVDPRTNRSNWRNYVTPVTSGCPFCKRKETHASLADCDDLTLVHPPPL